MAFATCVMLVVLAVQYRKELDRHNIVSIALSFLLGSALTLYHYLPTLHFKQYIQADILQAMTYGNWLPALLHGTQLTFVCHALILFVTHIAIVVFWVRHRSERNARLWFGVALFFLIIETPYLCKPIWDYVFPFQFIQFHTRFAIFTVLLLAIMAFTDLTENNWKRFARAVIGCWAIAGVLLSSLILFNLRLHPHGSSEWNDPAEYVPTKKINVYKAVDAVFLPHLADPMLAATPPLDSHEAIVPNHAGTKLFEWQMNTDRAHVLVLHQFYWPQLFATLDGALLDVKPDTINRMVLTVPEGQHSLALVLETAPIERIAAWISLIALALVLVFAGRQFVRHNSLSKL
jgi:hypothetical protein